MPPFLTVAAAGELLTASSASAKHVATGSSNWSSWGNELNENRYSPLTQIGPRTSGSSDARSRSI